MKYLFTILFFIHVVAVRATTYTWGTHSGGITINGSTTFGSPVIHGDVVVITGSFSNLGDFSNLNGILGDSITIDMTGATVTNGSYSQTTWIHCKYIKFVGLKAHNFFGTAILQEDINHFRVTGFKVLNDIGSYQNGQYLFQIGTFHNSNMLYVNNSNDSSKVFNGVRFDSDTLIGFQNAPCITNVNDGGYNLIINLEMDHLFSRSLTNNTTLGPGLFFGNGVLKFNIHHNDVDSFQADVGGCRCVHAEWFYVAGYGEYAYNKHGRSYGSGLRVYPAFYPGLTGYGSGSVFIHDNYYQNQLAYSANEANDQLTAALVTLGFDNSTIVTNVINNTVDTTHVYAYNAAHPTTPPYVVWNGAVVDVFQNNVHVYNNAIIHPYVDTTYGIFPPFVNTMSRTGTDTAGNRVSRYALQLGIDSTNLPSLFSNSILITQASNKTPVPTPSYNNIIRSAYPDNGIGAWFYVSGIVPPTIGPRVFVIPKKVIIYH